MGMLRLFDLAAPVIFFREGKAIGRWCGVGGGKAIYCIGIKEDVKSLLAS